MSKSCIQSFIDSAKMFYYAEQTTSNPAFPIVLTRAHFQQALNQLQDEAKILEKSFSDKLCKDLQPWGTIFAIAANTCILIKTLSDLLKNNPEILKKYNHFVI